MAVSIRRRERSRTKTGTKSVDQLRTMVDSLIKENRSLKRRLARLEAKASSGAATNRSAGAVTRTIATMARRIERALGTSVATTKRRRSGSSVASRRRVGRSSSVSAARRPASPETRAKRLAALARAREARAAKRATAIAASQ